MKLLTFTSHQVEDLIQTGVYAIVNTKNNKFYVGSAASKGKITSTCGFYIRWTHHISDLRLNKHHCAHLQNSWNKHGSDSFEFRILEFVEPEFCIETEQEYINCSDKNLLYNSSPTAGSSLGRKLSLESKQKMSEAKIRNFTLISPEGVVVEGSNLTKFAEDNGLRHLSAVIDGKSLHSKGYTASLEAHFLYVELYSMRAIYFDKLNSRWRITWHENKVRKTNHFKDLDKAKEFRDRKELELYKPFKILTKDWKKKLKEKGVSKDV